MGLHPGNAARSTRTRAGFERRAKAGSPATAPERDDATHQQKSRTQTGLRNVGEERSRRPAGRSNGSNRLPGASGHWSRTVNNNRSMMRLANRNTQTPAREHPAPAS